MSYPRPLARRLNGGRAPRPEKSHARPAAKSAQPKQSAQLNLPAARVKLAKNPGANFPKRAGLLGPLALDSLPHIFGRLTLDLRLPDAPAPYPKTQPSLGYVLDGSFRWLGLWYLRDIALLLPSDVSGYWSANVQGDKNEIKLAAASAHLRRRHISDWMFRSCHEVTRRSR